jgi:hypothetical protein
MDYIFSVVKRTFDNNAIIVFIDLLGTSNYWKSDAKTEVQAQETLRCLLSDFNIVFNKHFNHNGIKDSFDISIFADSVVISQRKKVQNIIDRLINFSLDYQRYLLQKGKSSRLIIIKDGFFSFKLKNVSKKSILSSKYTSVSLCGGRGIISAHERQKGLPIGVYVDNCLLDDLSKKYKSRTVRVKKDQNLLFIKQEFDITSLLPDNLQKLIFNKSNASVKSIRKVLEVSLKDKEEIDKYLPWILVHMGKEKEISEKLE